jgi:hypothetical protein
MTELTEVEERLRTGLARRAEHAPSADAVLTGLARAKPVRRRPSAVLWLAVAAAVTVVAVVGTVGVRSPADHQHVTPATIPPVRLTLTFGWLPAGFTERTRQASADGAMQYREWASGPTDGNSNPDVSMLYTDIGAPGYLTPLKPIGTEYVATVQGHQAVLSTSGANSAMIMWRPSADSQFEVLANNIPAALDVVIRLGDSIEPDRTSTVSSGLAFGVLPAGLYPVMSSVYGASPATANSGLIASDSDRWTPDVFVVLSKAQFAAKIRDEGTPTVVRGLSGWYRARRCDALA